MIIKSPKLDDDDNENLETHMNRELEFLESFDLSDPFVTCYWYFRIENQMFFFLEKYDSDL